MSFVHHSGNPTPLSPADAIGVLPMSWSIRMLYLGIYSMDFFPFSELAGAEHFFRGIIAAVLEYFSLFCLLLLS